MAHLAYQYHSKKSQPKSIRSDNSFGIFKLICSLIFFKFICVNYTEEEVERLAPKIWGYNRATKLKLEGKEEGEKYSKFLKTKKILVTSLLKKNS